MAFVKKQEQPKQPQKPQQGLKAAGSSQKQQESIKKDSCCGGKK